MVHGARARLGDAARRACKRNPGHDRCHETRHYGPLVAPFASRMPSAAALLLVRTTVYENRKLTVPLKPPEVNDFEPTALNLIFRPVKPRVAKTALGSAPAFARSLSIGPAKRLYSY